MSVTQQMFTFLHIDGVAFPLFESFCTDLGVPSLGRGRFMFPVVNGGVRNNFLMMHSLSFIDGVLFSTESGAMGVAFTIPDPTFMGCRVDCSSFSSLESNSTIVLSWLASSVPVFFSKSFC
ncbi:uncharacterized protein DS421_11g325150 [Arachis hypogaea]|nr:uncharacterized protein DS421_11g325150 [Arachis hypogaea]